MFSCFKNICNADGTLIHFVLTFNIHFPKFPFYLVGHLHLSSSLLTSSPSLTSEQWTSLWWQCTGYLKIQVKSGNEQRAFNERSTLGTGVLTQWYSLGSNEWVRSELRSTCALNRCVGIVGAGVACPLFSSCHWVWCITCGPTHQLTTKYWHMLLCVSYTSSVSLCTTP